MKTQSDATLKDINDLSNFIAGCFNVPNINIEKYSWVHNIYLTDEEGVEIGEINITRCDQSGLTYDICVPDYDRRKLLFTVNVQTDNELNIKERLMFEWNREVMWKIKLVEIKHRNLYSTLINWEMNLTEDG